MGFENLTEDVKAKAMDCETVEELERLAEEKGISFSDEKGEAVSGGFGDVQSTCRLG
jgi:hypothetical protein